MRTRTTFAALAGAFTLLAGAAPALAAGPAPLARPAALAGPAALADKDADAPVDRKIKDRRIEESSGLAASLRHPGVLWTINDSGNPPLIYAVGEDGETRAALTLVNEPNEDWEAVTALRVPGNDAAWLAVGDIGDNGAERDGVRIALLPEPGRLFDGGVEPARVLRLRYPGGARDAEALLADPRSGRLYVVSKTLLGADLYAVPKKIWPSRRTGTSPVTTLTKVASIPGASLVTDGTFLPDGRMLLRGYGKLFLADAPETAGKGRIAVLATEELPEQEQGESITLSGDDGTALVGSEGKREPVLRVAVPEAPPTASAGSEPTASDRNTTAGTTEAGSEPLLAEVGGRGTLLRVAGGAVVVLLALGSGAVMLRRRAGGRR